MTPNGWNWSTLPSRGPGIAGATRSSTRCERRGSISRRRSRWPSRGRHGTTIGSFWKRPSGSVSACASSDPQEAVELFVLDWRRRCPDPGGEELEKPAQALVVEQRRGLDHPGRGFL